MGDQKLNLKFVGEVEKHEELYNYKLPEYSRKDVTEIAWQKVAAEVNMTVADCKEKWRNLRTVFMRKLKPSPSGSRAKRKAYYLEDAMQFWLPFVKTSAPLSKGILPSVPVSSFGGHEDLCNEEMPQDSYSQTYFPLSEPPQTSQMLSEDSSTPPIQFLPSSAEVNQSVAEYFKAKKAKITAYETNNISRKIDKQESLKMFLLSLLPELEELNDHQIKMFKRKVFCVIDEISTTT